MRQATRVNPRHNGWAIMLLMVVCVTGAPFALESESAKTLPPIPITWHRGPATPERMNQRLEQAASQAKAHGPVPRLVLYDIAYPETPEEYSSTGGQAVLLITAVSHEKSELPIMNVRISINSSEMPLRRLRSVLSDTPHSDRSVVKTFGKYREDALYVLPVSLRLNAQAMLLDFAKNEANARLPFGPLPEPIAVLTKSPASQTPAEDGLEQFIKQQYPSFFKE